MGADAKAAAEKAEAITCFSDPSLVLTPRLGAPPASVNERADFLREKGIPDVAVKAALKELGQEEIPYERDYFGNIIFPNIINGNPCTRRDVVACRRSRVPILSARVSRHSALGRYFISGPGRVTRLGVT